VGSGIGTGADQELDATGLQGAGKTPEVVVSTPEETGSKAPLGSAFG
jgi:hypothetical protein